MYPRWLAWHVFTIACVAGMCALGDWQWHRAESGNALSWGYTFEWPFFAAMAIVFWVKTLRDEARPGQAAAMDEAVDLPTGSGRPAAAGVMTGVPADDGTTTGGAPAGGEAAGAGSPASADDSELAAYNAYLARLNAKASSRGR